MRLQKCLMLFCLWVSCTAAPAASAQEPAAEFINLPSSLPSDHLRNTPLYPNGEPPAQTTHKNLPAEFFAGLTQHPRLSLSRVKRSLSGYENRRRQYVRFELKDGRVLVGTVVYARDNYFVLRTGAAAEKDIEYSQMASEPQPVAGTGQKIKRDAEITGMVTVAVVLAPIVIPILLVACVFGTCVD